MKSGLSRVVMAWAAVVFVAGPSSLAAMEVPAGLGAGMHAFHGGDYAASFDWLSGVIEAGSKDPRAFYFRGLAARRCGRELEAEADFLEGARLEAMGNGGWNVGRALERVQGADRLLIERYRAKARTSLASQDREATGRRYSTDTREDDESIFRRRRPEVEGDDIAKPAAPKREAAPEPLPARNAEPAEEPAASDAFADEPAEEKPPVKAEAEEPAAEGPAPGGGKANPFGDDPFGAGEGEPAERKAAEAEGAADAADEQAEREAGGEAASVDDFK